MEVPDKAGNGVRGLGEPLGSFTKNFVKIGQQGPCEMVIFIKICSVGGCFFASRAPLIHFEWIQKLSNPPHFIHGERWCVQKNPTLKHLAKGHFFWDTLYEKQKISIIN